jgi:hypothetical protein
VEPNGYAARGMGNKLDRNLDFLIAALRRVAKAGKRAAQGRGGVFGQPGEGTSGGLRTRR